VENIVIKTEIGIFLSRSRFQICYIKMVKKLWSVIGFFFVLETLSKGMKP